MKNWVIAIYKIQSSLDRMDMMMRQQIERHTKDLVSDTYSVCDKILILLNNKVKLCNLRVLFNEMMDNFDDDERDLFKTIMDKRRYLSEMARECGLNKSTMLRRFDKLILKAAYVLIDLGFDEERLQSEYAGLISEKLKEKNKAKLS